MILPKLFLCFCQIGLFSIGGGHAAIPLIEDLVVKDNGWLSVADFTDLVTIAEITPGPIALNAASFVGNRIAGIPGAIIATLGCITPALVIVTLLALLYRKFSKLGAVQRILSVIRPVVVALIASAAITLVLQAVCGGETLTRDLVAGILFAAAFVVLRLCKISPIWVMLASGGIGGGLYLIVG